MAILYIGVERLDFNLFFNYVNNLNNKIKSTFGKVQN